MEKSNTFSGCTQYKTRILNLGKKKKNSQNKTSSTAWIELPEQGLISVPGLGGNPAVLGSMGLSAIDITGQFVTHSYNTL